MDRLISEQAVIDSIEFFQINPQHFDFVNLIDDIKEIPTAKPKWIPVNERLPEEGETVMASTLYGVYPEAKYSKEYGWEWAYEAGADYWRELEGVTAWMPLPKRYDPQESEE